jgi:hypothetical protein
MRFAIRYNDAFRWLAIITGTGPGQSWVDISADHVVVRMGWAFRACISRDTIRAVDQPTTIPFRYGLGVHGWAGTWAVNGSTAGGVRIDIDPAAKARVLFVPVTLKMLLLSLNQPEAFVATIDMDRNRPCL